MHESVTNHSVLITAPGVALVCDDLYYLEPADHFAELKTLLDQTEPDNRS